MVALDSNGTHSTACVSNIFHVSEILALRAELHCTMLMTSRKQASEHVHLLQGAVTQSALVFANTLSVRHHKKAPVLTKYSWKRIRKRV